MPDLVKRTSSGPALSSQTPTPENQVDGIAGEPIEVGDICYIDDDGLIYRASTANAAATFARGIAATTQGVGKPLTIYRSCAFGYTEASGANVVTPGKNFYVSSNAGKLSDQVPVGSGFRTAPVAFGWNDGNIYVDCR